MSAPDRPGLGVALCPGEPSDPRLRETSVLVIDVLRATTTIPRALEAGAARVIPVESVESAKQLRERLGGHALLCGEREGRKIAGFDLGNSPLEYEPKAVRDRVLIFSSTNGSRAVVRNLEARRLALGSFVNAARAVAWLAAAAGPCLVVCSGSEGRPSLEDTACAGLLVERLAERRPDVELDDGACVARTVWHRWRDDRAGLLRASSHGRALAAIGFAGDLEFSARLDAVPVLPVLREGQLEAEEPETESQASR